MKRTVVAFATFALVAVGVVAAGTSATAGPCGVLGSKYDGMVSPGASWGAFEGVSATMTTQPATQFCTPTTSQGNDSYVYVGVAGPYSNHGYAQIGYRQTASQGPRVTAFFTPTYLSQGVEEGTTWPTSISLHHAYTYSVTATAACNYCLSMNIGSTRVDTTPWSMGNWPSPGSAPWLMNVIGETHYSQTNIPGNNVGAATVISGVGVQRYSDDGWQLSPCTLNGVITSSRYGMNGSGNGGCGAWSIFTK